MAFTGRFASLAALAAVGSMVASPVAAAELPHVVAPAGAAATGVFDSDAVNAHQYRYYRRNRVDAGDVIGAVVLLGTIAAVANAVGKSGRTRGDEYRYPQRYPDQRYSYPDRRYDYRSPGAESRYDGSRGIDGAVDTCAREVERNARIETIDSANRADDGWRVSGRLSTGAAFDCMVGSNGRIESVDYGNGNAYRGAAAGGDAQWDDQRYVSARAAQDSAGGQASAEAAPAGGDDGRYETAQSPDFSG